MKQRKTLKKPSIKFGLSFLLMFCCMAITHAQNKTITGTVKDETGLPLPGVTIALVSKKAPGKMLKGTATDFDGNYSINTKSKNRSLTFSYIGYINQTVSIGENNVINVTLKANVSQLEEVMIEVGYGTQRKSDVTGAIQRIGAEEIARTQNLDLGDALAGKVAGVQLIDEDGTPGGGFKINIRGAASITGSTEPLYIVDGFPIEVFGDSDDTSEFSGGSSSNPLDFLDMASIETLDILKDASATAIYGARGANGVVIITTKKGKLGKTRFTYSSSYSIASVDQSRIARAMNTSEYFDYLTKIDYYALVDGDSGNRQYNDTTKAWEYLAPIDSFGLTFQDRNDEDVFVSRDVLRSLPTTDWQDELFGSGEVMNHSVNASGGKEGVLYSFTGSYLDQKGIVINTGYKRTTFSLKLDTKLTEKLSALTTISHSLSKTYGIGGGGGNFSSSWGLFARATQTRPYILLDDTGVDDEFDIDGLTEDQALFSNPVYQSEVTSNINEKTAYQLGTKLKYKITKDLTASSSFAYRSDASNAKFYNPPGFGRSGQARLTDKRQTSFVNNNTLLYKKRFNNKHDFSLLLGYTQQSKRTERLLLRARGFEANVTNGAENLEKATSISQPVNRIEEINQVGILSRLTYAYDRKYSFTASLRRDGDSRFNKDNRYRYFPSAGFAWTISRENFLKDSNVIDNLKLRITAGKGGNSGIRPQNSRETFIPFNYTFGGELVSGEAAQRVIDPNLTWQSTTQYDAGLELAMFGNRIRLTTDVYLRKTVDMILDRPLPYELGFNLLRTNVGDIDNYGLEIGLNTQIIKSDKFSWDTNLTMSFDRSEILSLGGPEQQFFANRVVSAPNSTVLQVGENVGTWYGYVMDGVYNTQEELDAHVSINSDGNEIPVTRTVGGREIQLGDPKYSDLNSDGKIDHNDQKIISKTQPDFYGGLWNNFKIGNFELGLFFRFKYNFDVINGNKLKHTYNIRFGANNQLASNLNAWSPDNPLSEQPRFGLDPDTGTTAGLPLSSYHVEDGSFIRLQNVNFKYNLPVEAMKNVGFINSCQIYFNVTNAFLWTKYSGSDPETSVSRGQLSNLGPNLDWGAYPKTRNFTMGLKASF